MMPHRKQFDVSLEISAPCVSPSFDRWRMRSGWGFSVCFGPFVFEMSYA